MGVHSIMMRPRSNPNTKAKIQCFSWAQVPALKSYWTSAPLAAVPTKIQNTEGIRKYENMIYLIYFLPLPAFPPDIKEVRNMTIKS